MSRYRLSLWSWLKCAGGRLIAPILPEDVVRGSYQRSVDGSHEAEIEVAREAWWIGLLQRNRVLRIDDAVLGTTEWLVRRITDQYGGVPTVRVWCAPVDDVLRMAGPIRHQIAGGRTYYSLGVVSACVHQTIDTWILPALAAAGFGFFSRGTIESLRLLSMGWSRWTPLELRLASAAAVGHETQLTRDGESGYAIDVVERIGADLPAVHLAPGRNLLTLIRTSGEGDYATSMIPAGATRDGSGERWGMEEATLQVIAVSAGVVGLSPRNGGEPLIFHDDCYVGLYLESAIGTREEILACDATLQTVTVGDDSDYAVGDDVSIVLDAAGTRLAELPHAGAIAEFRRDAVTRDFDELRGERNYARNPFFSDNEAGAWQITGPVVRGYVYPHGSSQSGTTIVAGFLPEGLEIEPGDQVRFEFPPGTFTDWVDVVTGGVVDGSGSFLAGLQLQLGRVTIELDESVSVGPTFAGWVRSASWAEATKPTYWVDESDSVRLRPIAGISMTGLLNGAVSADNAVSIDGLTPDAGEVAAGDLVIIGGSRYSAAGAATVEGGAVSLVTTSAVTAADNATVTIFRPAIPGRVGRWAANLGAVGIGDEPFHQLVTIPYYVGMGTRWFRIAGILWNPTTTARSSGSAGIRIRDEADTTTLGSAFVPSQSIPADTAIAFEVGVELAISSTMTYRVELVRPTGAGASLTMSVAWVMVSATEDVPPIEGSYGTEIAQAGVAALRRMIDEPIVYDTSLADLATQDGYDPATESVALGTPFLTGVPDLDLARRLRCVRIRPDLVDEARTEVTLATIPLTASTASPAPATQWTAGDEATAATRRQPPATVAGAFRAIGYQQAPLSVPADPDVLPIEEYQAV